MKSLAAKPISAEAFAPYGQLIAAPPDPGRMSYADGLADAGRAPVLSTTHVSASTTPIVVEVLERHPHSSQTFLPLDSDRWLVVVSSGPDSSGIEAFVVGPDVGVTIGRGVWHHRLTAIDAPGRFAVLMWKDGVTDDESIDCEPVRISLDPTGDAETGHDPVRDLVGYGPSPPNPEWPAGARLAINFVLNVEEGSEPSVPDGDGYSENRLTDSSVDLGSVRDLASEGLFEYGSRSGFWRVHRAFQERGLPLTAFACALALERNPEITDTIRDAGYDVCSHGYRWINHRTMSEAEEREQIARAVESFKSTLGHQPPGWYCRYGPSVNTRRLLVEHGGFSYDSDAYNDDLPYWSDVDGAAHLVVPYSLTTNDAKLMTMNGAQWADFIGDAADVLLAEGAERPVMMSIGLHSRIVGHPARTAGLLRVLDRIAALDDVWIASRVDIATHWARTHPAPGVSSAGPSRE